MKCICEDCGKDFELTSDDQRVAGKSTHIELAACASGGVYAVVVTCPHCEYRHELR